MGTAAVDDTDSISRRLAEREADRVRQRSCACRGSDDGRTLDSSRCPVHPERPASAPQQVDAAISGALTVGDWRDTAAALKRLLAEDPVLAQRLADLGLIAGE